MADSRKGIGGPKTPEGKRRSSLNAMKHAMYAASEQAMEALTEEIGRDFADLYEELRAHFKPTDPLEEVLVRRIARAAWRTLYTEAVENRDIIRQRGVPAITSCYEDIIRSERFIDIQLHRAIYALERKRLREYESSRNELDRPKIHEGIGQ